MRKIGIIGGMSWESSAVYYRIINEEIARRLGGNSSARLVMDSLNFEQITQWHRTGDWALIGETLSESARGLEKSGAECVVIACNTQHEVADAVQEAVTIPLIHIADPPGEAMRKDGLRKIGLLGTRFTMERPFMTSRLARNYGIETLLPPESDRQFVHDNIFDELAKGILHDGDRQRYLSIIKQLADRGAEGILLACTEISLLVRPEDLGEVAAYDTTALHAMAAVDFSLGQDRAPAGAGQLGSS